MSYDEQRISDQIDGGLIAEKRAKIKEFVKDWMDGHEPNTFPKNEHGVSIFSNGAVSLNIKCFFEDLLEDFIDDVNP